MKKEDTKINSNNDDYSEWLLIDKKNKNGISSVSKKSDYLDPSDLIPNQKKTQKI